MSVKNINKCRCYRCGSKNLFTLITLDIVRYEEVALFTTNYISKKHICKDCKYEYFEGVESRIKLNKKG